MASSGDEFERSALENHGETKIIAVKNNGPGPRFDSEREHNERSPSIVEAQTSHEDHTLDSMTFSKTQSQVNQNSPQDTQSANTVEVNDITELRGEVIDVTSIEDDTHNVDNNLDVVKQDISLRRNLDEVNDKLNKEQGPHSNIDPAREMHFDQYPRPSMEFTREKPELPPHYNKVRGFLPEYTYKPFGMYVPLADGANNRDAALRRAYYEEILQRDMTSQFRSAFRKPTEVEELGTQEMRFFSPAVRYGYDQIVQHAPYYKYPNDDALRESFYVAKTEFKDNQSQYSFGRVSEKHIKKESNMDDAKRDFEASGEYRRYGSNKYVVLDPRASYPYLPYRTPLCSLDKIPLQRETQCMYPCCAGLEKMQVKGANSERYTDTTTIKPYFFPPQTVAQVAQASKYQTEEMQQQNDQSSVNDPNGIHPSFKEFLDAERERLAANHKLTLESQTKSSITQYNPKYINEQNKTQINKHCEDKSPSKFGDDFTTMNTTQPTRTETSKEPDLQIAETIDREKISSQSDSSPPVKKIACSVCNKTFNRTSNLYTHMRTHSAHKPHVCEFCGKRFHQKADLRIHRYIHTGEKPHKCTKCGRGFKQLTHLKYHLRTHSDVRMYKCPYCEKGFNQKSNLQAHIFGHTGQRPHKCDVCGKGFTLASTLNTHKRTHLPNKPFQCKFCERAFYQKNALKMHYVSTHPYSSGAV